MSKWRQLNELMLLNSSAIKPTRKNADKPVVKANTVVDVWTVVIKCQYAAITLTTMFSSQRLHSLTCVTQSTQWVHQALITPVLIPCHLHTRCHIEKHYLSSLIQTHKQHSKFTWQQWVHKLRKITKFGRKLAIIYLSPGDNTPTSPLVYPVQLIHSYC